MALADQREVVLARIREALRRPAPHRHRHERDSEDEATSAPDTPPAFRDWLPLVGGSETEQINLFAQNARQLRADFRLLSSLEEAERQLAQLARDESWQRVATHRFSMASTLAEKLGLPCLFTDSKYATRDLERCDAALTGCDALVAQTGSILVTNASAGGRALSVLAPHHIVVAQRNQMVPDLSAALDLVRKVYSPSWPSFLSFITGPSRTGDIERILVLGAHGPKKLTIFLLP